MQRVATTGLVLLGAVSITFLLSHLIPVDPVTAWLGKGANPELVAIYRSIYHFDDPLHVQYFYYIVGLLHLQLGFSPTRHEPVTAVISQTFPYTLQLVFLSMIITTVMGIVGGMLSAKYAGGAVEKTIRTSYIASTQLAAQEFAV
jgi:peptide/nickel transport system permease protein